jgi:2-dehydro-3-deoxygluconokinase
MSSKVVTFGEVMMRLNPPGFLRIAQTRSFDATYAGGEVNVAIAVANFGMPAAFVTRIPDNEVGDGCINYIRQFGVDTSHVIRGGDRLGIYFVETGASQRGSKVIYDRAGSSIASIAPGMVNWTDVFKGSNWFHWTGITPAISKGAADACLEAVKKAKEMGLTVSCDLNYRAKLWKWGETPENVMLELVKYCDIVIGNEEDAEKIFGIKAPSADVEKGHLDADAYRYVCEKLVQKFPNVKLVGITLRESISASHNKWSAVLYDAKARSIAASPSYDIFPIVDRVGGGDSFSGSLIYALLTYNSDLQKSLNFAVAASCIKHTIYGDALIARIDEVEKLMKGVTSGRISR